MNKAEEPIVAAVAEDADLWTADTGESFRLNRRMPSQIEIARLLRLERSTDITDLYELVIRSYERFIDPVDHVRFLDWAEGLSNDEAAEVQQALAKAVAARPTSPSGGSTDGSQTTGPDSGSDSSATE